MNVWMNPYQQQLDYMNNSFYVVEW